MQTLVFNTKDKTIYLLDGFKGKSTIMERMENVTTVKIAPEGFYEVMQKPNENSNAIPVLRLPIANTNMFIES